MTSHYVQATREHRRMMVEMEPLDAQLLEGAPYALGMAQRLRRDVLEVRPR